MILKDYQQSAVDKIKEIIDTTYRSDKRILLKAPTGSGKTVMATFLMENINKVDRDTCFIWISIGKSGLHEQSKDKCSAISKTLTCYSPEDIMDSNISSLSPGDSLFLNWESISRKDRKKEWMNIFMKEGEHTDFTQLMDNTRKVGTKIFLLIDEAHTSTSMRSEEIIRIISPDITLLVTATPKPKQIKESSGFLVEVSSQVVIDEGVIKKGIIVNKDIFVEGNIINTLLRASIKRREYLKKLYKKSGSDINPLCLIQVPNGVEGEGIAQGIEKALNLAGISIENNKLAVWTTEDKINLTVLKNLDSPQEYLIFKQAIDTGWDCPRAQILLKLRDIKSETFKEQLLGRLLRMPELKHYGNEILNYAYVYTNEEEFVVDNPGALPEDLKLPTETIYIKEEYLDQAINTVVPTFPLVYNKSELHTKQFIRDIVVYLSKKIEVFTGIYNDNSSGYEVLIPKDLKISSISYNVLESDTTEVKMTPGVIKYMIMKSLNESTGDKKISEIAIAVILNNRPDDVELYDYLNMILFNIEDISYKIRELKTSSTITDTFDINKTDIIYSHLPTEISIFKPPNKSLIHSKNIYKFFPRENLYKIEENLIEEFEEEQDVLWWSYLKTFMKVISIPELHEDNIVYYSPMFLIKTNNNRLTLIDSFNSEEDFQRKKTLLEILVKRSNLPNLGYKLVESL